MALGLTLMDVRQILLLEYYCLCPSDLLCKASSEPQEGQRSKSPLSFETCLGDYFLLAVNRCLVVLLDVVCDLVSSKSGCQLLLAPFILVFIQQIIIEHILCARNFSSLRDCINLLGLP